MPTTDLTAVPSEELDARQAEIAAEIARRAELARLPEQYRSLMAQAEQVAQRYEHVGGNRADLKG